MVPEGWLEYQLQDACGERIVYGIVQAGDHVEGGVPYIKSSDVGGEINVNGLAKTSPDIHRRYKRSTVGPGDIIFSLRGNTGATSIVPRNLPEANLTQGTARIAVNAEADNRFLLYQLGSHAVRSHIYAVSKGSTFTEISLADLRKVPIHLPPLPEQKKIADILSTWDQAIETAEKLLANAETQKRGLMQQLLTGKRRLEGFERQEWENCRLVDRFDFINGRAFKPDDWGDVGLPIIRIQNLTGSTSTLNYFEGNVDEKHMIRKGDFLLSWSATLETFIWSGPDAVLNQHIFKVAPKPGTVRNFGYHLLTYEIGKLTSKVHGTSMKHITKRDLSKIESSFPSYKEQQEIAVTLDNAQKLVDCMKADIRILLSQKLGLMQQLLTGRRRVRV